MLGEAVDGGAADAAGGDVDDPLEVDVAGGVQEEAEVGEEVLDLLAVEDAEAAL